MADALYDPISIIESAMVERLKIHNQNDTWGFRVKNIDAYGGQFDTPEEIARAASQSPGLWVTFQSKAGRIGNNRQYEDTLTFAVFALAKSYRPEELRRGGPETIGLYQLIAAVTRSFLNQDFGLTIKPLELASVTPLWRGGPQGGGISLSILTFTTQVSTGLPEADFELDGPVCPNPLYVTAWDTPLGVFTDQRSNDDD